MFIIYLLSKILLSIENKDIKMVEISFCCYVVYNVVEET